MEFCFKREDKHQPRSQEKKLSYRTLSHGYFHKVSHLCVGPSLTEMAITTTRYTLFNTFMLI